MGYYEHFSLGKRNLDSENKWEEIDIDNYRIKKPTVLCLGGNGSISPKKANSLCKIAQNLVGLKQPTTKNEFATTEDVDFVGIAYGRYSKNDNTSFLTDEESKEIVDKIFLPMCKDENGNVLPREKILKNFNMVTIFSHCYGAKEASIMLGRTINKMSNMGIDMATACDAVNQIFAVSYAPFEECGCPSLQIIPMKDQVLIGGPNFSDISHRFLMDKFLCDKNKGKGTVAFKEDSFTISLIVSDMTDNVSDEHGVIVASRDEAWQFMEDDTYFGDEVSQVMGNALAKSISNSIQNFNSETFTPKPSLDEILEETKSILGETKSDAFENAIHKIKWDLGAPENIGSLQNVIEQHSPQQDDLQPE